MALRKIILKEDETLRKKSKPVEKFDEKLWALLDDMAETLKKASGAGLAAPQVGVLRRVAIINLIGEEGEEDKIIELINPEILKSSGTQRDIEGCLSCPGLWGYVTRPLKCKIRAQNRHGETFEIDLKGHDCRCAFHEIDHLNGKLFIDIADEMVDIEEEK